MNTKLHKTSIALGENYWYVYQGGGKCQLIMISSVDELELGDFHVVLDIEEPTFNSMPIRIDTDEEGFYLNLFQESDKENAEITWVYNFVKNFKSNTFVEYSDFLGLYSKLMVEHPELMLKGL